MKMAEIKDVKVWSNPTKTEYRIYVHATDGRDGCLYLTGNSFNAKGSKTGNLSDEEWKQARAMSVEGGRWHTVYAQPKSTRPARRCPDCGGYDCKHECNANHKK